MRMPVTIGPTVRRAVARLLIASMAIESVSCGTIIHPERRGQPSGRLDPAIVALDGIGLLLFFIPGVIAFAVDFSTGAIYLPERYGERVPQSLDPQRMTRLDVQSQNLNRERLEQLVRERTGQTVDLNSPAVRVSRLENIQEAPAAVARLAAGEQ